MKICKEILPSLALTPPTTLLNEALETPHSGGSGKAVMKSDSEGMDFPDGVGVGGVGGVGGAGGVSGIGGGGGGGRGQQTCDNFN